MAQITILDAESKLVQLTSVASVDVLSQKIAQYQALFGIGVKFVDIFVYGWMIDMSYNTHIIDVNDLARVISIPYKAGYIIIEHGDVRQKVIIDVNMPTIFRLAHNVAGHAYWLLYRDKEIGEW